MQDAGLFGLGGSVVSRLPFLGKTPPRYAMQPRDCPYRPRAPQRVRVRARPGVGLVWADVQAEIDVTHAAQNIGQAAPAHSRSRQCKEFYDTSAS